MASFCSFPMLTPTSNAEQGASFMQLALMKRSVLPVVWLTPMGSAVAASLTAAETIPWRRQHVSMMLGLALSQDHLARLSSDLGRVLLWYDALAKR